VGGRRLLPARGGTADEKDDAPPPDGDGSQLDRRIRPALGDHLPRGQGPEGPAAGGWGDSNSTSLVSSRRGQRAVGRVTCGFAIVGCPLVPVVVHGPPVGCGPGTYRLGFRSRLVGDACGAPVLRDQGSIGRPGTARPIQALTSCMPRSFRVAGKARSSAVQPTASLTSRL
jgi:hypothetical protein